MPNLKQSNDEIGELADSIDQTRENIFLYRNEIAGREVNADIVPGPA
jgi:hypothetical protein